MELASFYSGVSACRLAKDAVVGTYGLNIRILLTAKWAIWKSA
jgi:hypothetical protein